MISASAVHVYIGRAVLMIELKEFKRKTKADISLKRAKTVFNLHLDSGNPAATAVRIHRHADSEAIATSVRDTKTLTQRNLP